MEAEALLRRYVVNDIKVKGECINWRPRWFRCHQLDGDGDYGDDTVACTIALSLARVFGVVHGLVSKRQTG